MKNGILEEYEFDTDSYEVIDKLGVVLVINYDLFIKDMINFVKMNGCFPAILMEDLTEDDIKNVNIQNDDVIWHDVEIIDENGNIQKVYNYVDSTTIQRNGRRVVNSTIISNSLLDLKHNDVRLIRAISDGFKQFTGKYTDHSVSICDYLDYVNITDVCTIFGIDRSNKNNIVVLDKKVFFLNNHDSYLRFTNFAIDLITPGFNVFNKFKLLAFCKECDISAGKYIVGDVDINLQHNSDIKDMIKFICKQYENAVEIVRSDD